MNNVKFKFDSDSWFWWTRSADRDGDGVGGVYRDGGVYIDYCGSRSGVANVCII